MTKRSSKRVDPFYLSPEWKAIRLKRLRMDRWHCTQCGCPCGGKKRGQASPHVDHIKTRRQHPELQLDINNLRTLCHPCHSQRTRLDQLARPQIGPDGYPIETGHDPSPRYRDPFTHQGE